MSRSRLLWITAAFEPELDLLQKELDGKEVPWMGESLRFRIFPTGIGMLESALSLQEALLQGERPDQILLLGSAGLYVSHNTRSLPYINRFLLVDRVSALSSSYLKGEEHQLKELVEPLVADTGGLSLWEQLKSRERVEEGGCNAPGALTLEEIPPEDLTPHLPGEEGRPLCENMEARGSLAVALRYTIPWCGLFAITNQVGPEGSSQWRENYRKASTDLQRLLLELFS